jgi:Flp pilus assembly pilin Flp
VPRRRADRGATAVEYAVLAAFIAVVVLVAITFLGQGIDHLLQLGHDAMSGSGE